MDMGKPVHKDMVHYVFEIMIITKYLKINFTRALLIKFQKS